MDNSSEKDRLRQRILLHKVLNRAEQPVQLARQAMQQSTLRDKQQSQAENLLRVALETDSPAVVLNWLAYQKSRKGPPGYFWGNSGLAEKVTGHIENELLETAQKFANDVYGQEDAAQVKDIRMQLVRLYAGYLKRWYAAGVYQRQQSQGSGNRGRNSQRRQR